MWVLSLEGDRPRPSVLVKFPEISVVIVLVELLGFVICCSLFCKKRCFSTFDVENSMCIQCVHESHEGLLWFNG
jgi:hypothetical protein